MALIQNIKAAQLQSRKNRNDFRSSLLTTIIGEAEMVGKTAGNRESTDAEVLAVLKKFEKGANETIRFLQVAGNDNQEKIAVMECELAIIREFLPQKLSDEKVKDDIVAVMIANDLKYEQKSAGTIVKELKSLYGDQFDGQQISAIFKSML